ncbi:MAG TPA: glycoside hydrolase family 3 protein [Rhabdochlamydiaceae bacterium]|nr:glycoside hydrolase family 3 protein [Rhabdochlamydiaceae bacterium]
MYFFLLFLFFFQVLFAHDINTLSLDEKIGQLFIVPARFSPDGSHRENLLDIIHDYHIGGIILKQGDPLSQVKLIQELQMESKIPLLCVQDAEWGLSMRLSDTVKFPRNLTLGAIQDDDLIYQLGKEIGRTCKKVGTHVNLAPIVDVNNNPCNPVIHMRSFGENPHSVARKAVAYLHGLASEGILGCAKHFPGHGDTAVDSHFDLPIIYHSLEHLSKVELYPFVAAIEAGIPCVMSAHLSFPAFEPFLPVTFSSKMITELLKQKMGFQGLVITDALNMKALTNYYPAKEIGLKALLAGHDLLLYGDHIAPNIERILTQDVPEAFNRIKQAILDGELQEKELDEHVDKILKIKEKLDFSLSSDNLLEEINSPEAKELKRQLYRSAITLVSNPDHLLPLSSPGHYALLSNGKNFIPHCDYYFHDQRDVLFANLKRYDAVIVGLYEKPTEELIEWIHTVRKTLPVIIVLFQTPYCLLPFDPSLTLIMAYENDPDAEEAAKDLIFGQLIPTGKLPISY